MAHENQAMHELQAPNIHRPRPDMGNPHPEPADPLWALCSHCPRRYRPTHPSSLCHYCRHRYGAVAL
jgi:hypothetical protein